MRFRLLGPLAVETDDGLIDLGPPKQKAVLAVLLLHANDIVPTERIIDLVWGEGAPRTAEHSVQIYISDLRKILSNGRAALIETRPPGYVLNVPIDAVDALRFQATVREALTAVRGGDVGAARSTLERALDIWQGAPLTDFAYETFAQGYIRSLEEMHTDALEALAGIHLEQRDYDEARLLARAAMEADPLREEPHRLMMLALYRTGRQAEALRHYGEYSQLLADELGIEPSEALRELEERILLQDASLDVGPATTSTANPYRGLRAFSEDDADVYFGRESLVDEVLERLDHGHGLVSIVGPSGSGKSSAARAGVVPELRSRGESVIVFQPGARPLWELAGALDRAGCGSRATILRRFEGSPDVISEIVRRPLIVVIDQFEELFTLAEPDTTLRFARLISFAIRDERVPLRVVATLRADYYDRPLSIPELAGVFSDSVVSVKPMAPQELERAVTEPARSAGKAVEPALLAQLVADMGDEPGALPLLQVTLFELFERSSNGLTLADYLGLGGLHGALTGGADEVLGELDDQGQDVAEQLMMRMVRKGRALSTARPVPLRDLIDLGPDRVALQRVLEAFGARRLITFDRDADGGAVVQMAHEFLISEWPQMEAWIGAHSEDLGHLYSLQQAARDWEGADRSEDYLLRGARLERFTEWNTGSSLRLTRGESEYLKASIELRDRLELAKEEQVEKEEALRRSARRRLWAFGIAVVAFAAATTFLVLTLMPDPPPDAVIMYNHETPFGYSALVGQGFRSAAQRQGLEVVELSDQDPIQVPILGDLVERGTPLVLLQKGSMNDAPGLAEIMGARSRAQFVWIDCDPPDVIRLAANQQCITVRETELGFLAGVVAAKTTSTGRVGIVVGTDAPFMYPFHMGFVQGVAHIDPTVDVRAVYLSHDGDGFASATLGELGARVLMSEGADVIFHAAGLSGLGVLFSAVEAGLEEGHTWVIGVDEDMHAAVGGYRFFGPALREELQGHVLTSIIKRIDIGVAEAVDQFAESGTVGPISLGIDDGGVDYVTTGGYIDGIVPIIEAVKRDIRSGDLVIEDRVEIEQRMLADLVEP